MPTNDERRPLGEPDDGAYVVDTRRRLKRPGSGALASGRDRGQSAPLAEGSPPPHPSGGQQVPGRSEDDGYVVDTRGARRRPSPAPGGALPPDHGEPHTPSPGPGEPPRRRRRVRKGRLTLLVVALLVLGWLAFMVWVPVNAWNNVSRVDNIPAGERPADTSGHTYLLVGSDSREGLTAAQRKEYATGNAAGKRTDTIMLVHVSDHGGKPVLVSIPRDSYVPIPGHGSNKINAAFAFGGAKLLTETVEQVTGLHLDGYLEIGFGGFAQIVDSLGGVHICVARDMNDEKAHINLKKGCQVLNGPNALGYVRARYSDPLGDIGRANRQRQFLGAVMKQAATPSTVLIPWRYKSFVDAAAGGIIVGDETSMRDATRILQAMRAVSNDEGLSLTVPVENAALPTNAGIAVKWNTEQAKALFKMLKNDEPLSVPPEGTVID
jgi:LCP family protein required for cell wall assembly